MPRSGFALDGPTPDKPLWDRVKAWMNENAPGVVDAVSSAADTMITQNPPVRMALRGMGDVMRRGDPMNVMGGPTAMTLAHGTPAVWAAEAGAPLGQARRAFRMSGEGAAMAGEGFYAAQRGSVGESYRTGLSRPRDVLSVAIQDAVRNELPKRLEAAGIADEAARLRKTWGTPYESLKAIGADPGLASDHVSAVREYAKARGISVDDLIAPATGPGSLYALDYPDELLPRTLDFDAPLAKQTPEVQEALRAKGLWPEVAVHDLPADPAWGTLGGARKSQSLSVLGEPAEWFDVGVDPLEKFTGQSLYHALTRRNGGTGSMPGSISHGASPAAEEASLMLAEAGIPGHKFLDGGSRGANAEPSGTYNFVVYEPDKTLKTLGRYPNLEEFLKAHPEVPR